MSYILSFAALAALVAAVPAPFANNTRQSPNLQARQMAGNTVWTNPAGGNTIIAFSDTTIDIGTVTPQAIMSKAFNDCSMSVGICGATGMSSSGTIIDPNDSLIAQAQTIDISVQGDYPTWMHEALFDALTAAVNTVATSTTNTVPENSVSDCAYGCGTTTMSFTSWTVPQVWGIQFNDQNDNQAAPPFIQVTITQAPANTGFCTTLTGLGSAILGALGPEGAVAAAGMALVSLSCASGP